MNEEELAALLKERYEKAKRNEASLQIHLSGIEYAEEIRNGPFTIAELVEKAGISRGYAAELSKGVKLAGHVVVRREA